MRHANSSFGRRAAVALQQAASGASNGIAYDEKGYCDDWRANLQPGLPLDAIESDFRAGDGNELREKFCAAHSSACLAVNAFRRWRLDPSDLRLGGGCHFRTLRFEAKMHFGLRRPANLDVLATADTTIVGIESKCLEWIRPKDACFSEAYEKLRPIHGRTAWFDRLDALRANPGAYGHVDAAQLVKHALGLASTYPSGDIQLWYVFWEPVNHSRWEQCGIHREQAHRLAADVAGDRVQLVPMSHLQLWEQWAQNSAQSSSLQYLRSRYWIEV
ncbi:hypothetical protein F183_A04410 [Bryobacterales bacterium F-183]|nr:hypothetical protein F183_A04410 [Bryobacterales bacterium F-183]